MRRIVAKWARLLPVGEWHQAMAEHRTVRRVRMCFARSNFGLKASRLFELSIVSGCSGG
jgi:hypothetical protein